uniref:ACB domain-containing protein n=1 Tax=Brugia timori TaxID=42155 RepID=A0A0R3QDM1_9BILA
LFCGNHSSIWNLFARSFEDEKPNLWDGWNRKTEYKRGRVTEGRRDGVLNLMRAILYSFKRGTKNEKGWSCRGRPLKT